MNNRARQRGAGKNQRRNIGRGRRVRRGEGGEPFSTQSGDLQIIRKPLSQPQIRQIPRKPLMRELKYFDSYSSGTIGTNGAPTKISAVPQGATDLTRNGDAIQLVSLEIRSNSAMTIATDFTNLVRIVVFQWTVDDTGTAPVLADVFQSTTATESALSAITHDNNKKVDVLADHLFCLSGAGQANDSFHAVQSRFAQPLISYVAATTTGVGNLYFVAVSDSAAIPFPVLNIYFRINFFDT